MNLQTARHRADIIFQIREFFRERKALEVETPILSHGGTTDCHLDSFETTFHPTGSRRTRESETLFLQTSPEFAMKRLLAAGYGDIFQICKTFRNGEKGTIHNPEFTMLEWYRVGFGMMELIDETVELLRLILGRKELLKKTYAELFEETLCIDPLAATLDELSRACASRRISMPSFCAVTDALQFVMSEVIEPSFPKDNIVVVHHYPAEQAVFAVLEPDAPATARRFEAYFNGMELVNGFEELADAAEYERRMTEENVKRQSIGKPEIPLDRLFLDSLKRGFPPCAGAALGLDRLVMLALNKSGIDEAISFPLDKS